MVAPCSEERVSNDTELLHTIMCLYFSELGRKHLCYHTARQLHDPLTHYVVPVNRRFYFGLYEETLVPFFSSIRRKEGGGGKGAEFGVVQSVCVGMLF